MHSPRRARQMAVATARVARNLCGAFDLADMRAARQVRPCLSRLDSCERPPHQYLELLGRTLKTPEDDRGRYRGISAVPELQVRDKQALLPVS
jgi:hypothetical protein